MTTFKNFKLKEIFDISGTKSLDAGNLKFVEHGFNFVGRTFENNGVQGKIEKQFFEPNEANTITATVIGNYKYIKYQEEPYYCSQNINKLSLHKKFGFTLNYRVALYFITLINAFVKQYDGQQGGYKLNDLSNYVVSIPIVEGSTDSIDFQYMENYIKGLEQERIKELEQERVSELGKYLEVTGLNDFSFDTNDETRLTRFRSNCLKIASFNLPRIFEIKNTNNITSESIVYNSGSIPYLTATNLNNSVTSYISYDTSLLEPGNVIFVGGKTLTITYQKVPFFSNDSHNLILKVRNNPNCTEDCYLFLIASLHKSLDPKYCWNNSISNKKIQLDTITLPILTDSNGDAIIEQLNENNEYTYHDKGYIPDWSLMEEYIQTIKKTVIADVVKHKDLIIQATKNVVAE